jgi:hypothetical protein
MGETEEGRREGKEWEERRCVYLKERRACWWWQS